MALTNEQVAIAELVGGGQTTLHSHAGGGEAFPVGSVFIGVVATNPSTLLGYGTWSAFGAGRVLVGLDAGDTDFDVVEETGGAKTHNHADHPISSNARSGSNIDIPSSHTHDTQSNIQPYIVVYMWKRIV